MNEMYLWIGMLDPILINNTLWKILTMVYVKNWGRWGKKAELHPNAQLKLIKKNQIDPYLAICGWWAAPVLRNFNLFMNITLVSLIGCQTIIIQRVLKSNHFVPFGSHLFVFINDPIFH